MSDRPSGPPRTGRRRSWREAELAAIDFETTGLDLRRDAVVSVGVVPVRGGRVILGESLYREVRPTVSPSARSVAVHELRTTDLADAPPIEAIREDLRAALAGRYLIAWVADVEVAFLARTFGGSSRWWHRRTIDAWRLAMALDRLEGAKVKERRTLAGSCAHFGVPIEEAHHALGDAIMTAELFLVLATKLEARGQGTIRALARAR